nr:protein terminal ear1-like [Ipomoea batatas]
MDDSGFVDFRAILILALENFSPNNPFGSLLPPPPQPAACLIFPYPPYHLVTGGGCGVPSTTCAAAAADPVPSAAESQLGRRPGRFLISMLSPDASESLVRRELEVFGDVRARSDGAGEGGHRHRRISYNSRHSQAGAAGRFQQQHMHQQYRPAPSLNESVMAQNFLSPPPPPRAAARGLIAGTVKELRRDTHEKKPKPPGGCASKPNHQIPHKIFSPAAAALRPLLHGPSKKNLQPIQRKSLRVGFQDSMDSLCIEAAGIIMIMGLRRGAQMVSSSLSSSSYGGTQIAKNMERAGR